MEFVKTALAAVLIAGLAACSSAPPTESELERRDQVMREEVQKSVTAFKRADPTIQTMFDSAHAYVVFPRIGKGGLVFGGSYGQGKVYQGGQIIGNAAVTKVSVGLQAGGQVFREIIFFQDQATLDRFKKGEFALSAEATAVVAADGAAASADYSEGVAVFVMPIKGLMVEAAIGGQKFSYRGYATSEG